MNKTYINCLLTIVLLVLCLSAWASDTTYRVVFNTTPLVGHPAGPFYFLVELTSGADLGTGSDKAVLSDINLEGGTALTAPLLYGGAAGSLDSGVTLSDSQPLSVFSALFVPGTQLSFTLRLYSMDNTEQTPGGIAIFLLDSSGEPIPTLAPAGNYLLSAGLRFTGPEIVSFASDSSRSPSLGSPIAMAAPMIQLVSRQVKSHVSTDVQALIPTGSREADEQLMKVLRYIDASISLSLWSDDYHLTKEGDQVFWEEWQAVRELEEIGRMDSHLSIPLRSAESTLALVDRAIAQTALTDALGGGTSESFAKVQGEISLGDIRASHEEFAAAIGHYREAWILVGNPRSWTPAPTISPASGEYSSPQTLVITDALPGAIIYYTTDGSLPSASSTTYIGRIVLNGSRTVKAIAVSSGVSSAVTSSTYTIALTTSEISLSTGIGGSSLDLNNGAAVADKVLHLTDGGADENRSAWFKNKVSVGSFTTDFGFQLLSPNADGFAFVIQNSGTLSVGTSGDGLGYQGIHHSVALKFDLHNNEGEGRNSTGVYLNGVAPTMPAVDLTTSGVNLHSGHVMHAHVVYDGRMLTLTLTDPATSAVFVQNFAVDIPGTVGGNRALVGFTGGTGSNTAVQNILSWTYSSNNDPAMEAPAPDILPGSKVETTSFIVTMHDATPGAAIYYTTDGTSPSASSTLYAGPFTGQPGQIINAVAIAAGYAPSSITTVIYSPPETTYFNYPAGAFTSTGMILNNGAKMTGNLLQLTDGGGAEARSAWYATPVSVNSFITDFTFQLLNADADGFTFAIQNSKATAIGVDGSGLGYQGIGKSVALKFDIYDTSGEGINSTGIYLNGAAPTMPAADLTNSGIDLHSGHVFAAHVDYDGMVLALSLTDTMTNDTITQTFPADIPGAVGSSTAYVGFTAGTGRLSSVQDILSWSFRH